MSVNYYDPFSPPKTDSLIYYAMMTLTLGIPRFRKFPPLHVPGSGIRVFRTKRDRSGKDGIAGVATTAQTRPVSLVRLTRPRDVVAPPLKASTEELLNPNVPVVETNEAGNRGPYYGA
jgi:hypothetical protein